MTVDRSNIPTPGAFFGAAAHPLNGNTAWSQRYAAHLRSLIIRQAEQAARTQLARTRVNGFFHIGPSEIGVQCDRQVVGKLVGAPRTNHVTDPWPSVMGTAGHAWMEHALNDENTRLGFIRYLTEKRVRPFPDHPGSADAYDGIESGGTLLDWKFLGDESLAKVKKAAGPSVKYKVQLLLYFLGYLLLGYPVNRVALVALPRTKSTLDSMYVWEYPLDAARDAQILAAVSQRLEHRKALARAVQAGSLTLHQILPTPDDDECYFCPLYRPQSAHDSTPGCPGTLLRKAL